MARLPPLEKLSLAARKNLRDEWLNVQAEVEQQLSHSMGTEWKIDIEPLAIVPYAVDGSWSRDSPGSMISTYVKDAVRYLGEYEQLRDDINKLASAHVLTMDLNEDETFSYCGPKFLPGGKLAIVFRADRLGVNISDAFYRENLEKAISLVPTEEALGFYARKNISDEWEPQVESLQSQLKGILNRDITIVPNFEDVYNKLKSTKESSDFEQNIGLFVQLYFKALINELKSQKFDSDDMLQEALNEALDKGEVHFRVVDRIKGDCGEVAIGGGILYLQTTPDRYGCNIDKVARNIMDIL